MMLSNMARSHIIITYISMLELLLALLWQIQHAETTKFYFLCCQLREIKFSISY
jgi:hypothetical protein